MVKCEQVQLIQYVKVRKHQADLKLLQSLLRDSKCLSNKEISKQWMEQVFDISKKLYDFKIVTIDGKTAVFMKFHHI